MADKRAKDATDLCGKKVGTTRSTSFPVEIEKWSKQNCEPAGKPAIQYVPGENSIDVRNQLKQGRIDAAVQGSETLPYAQTQEPGKYRVVGEPFAKGYQGIMFRKDDAALREVVTREAHRDDRRRLLQGRSRQMGPRRQRGRPAHAERGAAMKPAPALAEGFPDLSGMRIAREPHWFRWLSAALIVLVLAAIVRAFADGQIEWSYVSRFLTAKVILEGIVNTMVMAVLAMALGIVLGVVVAIMRLSPNPVLKTVAAGYTWLFRGTPLILQLLLWFNLALVFPTIGIPGLWSCARRRRHDAVPRRTARARHQPGRLYVRGDARRHAVGRHRAI